MGRKVATARYFTSGDVEIPTGGSDPMTFKVPGSSAEHIRGLWSGLGAVLTGRRTFDKAEGWGEIHAGTPVVLGNPTVIAGVGVTHLRSPVRKA